MSNTTSNSLKRNHRIPIRSSNENFEVDILRLVVKPSEDPRATSVTSASIRWECSTAGGAETEEGAYYYQAAEGFSADSSLG